MKNCVDMCVRHGSGGDRGLFVRKGGASQEKVGKTELCSLLVVCFYSFPFPQTSLNRDEY